jgi:hypothetical protein
MNIMLPLESAKTMKSICDTYPSWALATYVDNIEPTLGRFSEDLQFEKTWLDSCGPGVDGATRYRLFPGSLFLLWVQAMGGYVSDESVRIAAAIECLHNASLHHDDVLDGHDSRRGIDTVLALTGINGSILAGDALFAITLKLLGSFSNIDAPMIITKLGTAWLKMNYGQWMDEVSVWQTVPIGNHEKHWKIMTQNKLSIGNIAAPLAACWLHRVDLVESLTIMHEEFSLVSQILNDIGDQYCWAGFHVIGPCKRPPKHEAMQKTTIATIWAVGTELQRETCINSSGLILKRAHKEVLELTNCAILRLKKLDIDESAKIILFDFFNRPLAEFEKVIGGGVTENGYTYFKASC